MFSQRQLLRSKVALEVSHRYAVYHLEPEICVVDRHCTEDCGSWVMY